MTQQTMYPGMINSPQTELSAAISDTDESIPVVAASLLPSAPNLATIGTDETAETILYTGKSGNNLTGVTRGVEGAAKSWSAGAKIARNFTHADLDAVQKNISDHETRLAAQKAEKVSPKNPPAPLVACKGDWNWQTGTATDDSAAMQAIINYCITNKRTLDVSDGCYYLPSTIVIEGDFESFALIGSSSPSAYSQGRGVGVTFVTNGNDLFEVKTQYPHDHYEFRNFYHYNASGSKVGDTILINHASNPHQIKDFIVDNVKSSKNGHLIKCTATAAINAPYLYLRNAYTYDTAGWVEFDGVATTIFVVDDSLIHVTEASPIKSNASVIAKINNTWFEGCEPTALELVGDASCEIDLCNTYFEACGITSAFGAWKTGKYKTINIHGGSNLPGTLMDAAVLEAFCKISSDVPIRIKSNGGLVQTPKTVSLDPSYNNYAYLPMDQLSVLEDSDRVYIDPTSTYIRKPAGVPGGVADKSVWVDSAYAVNHGASLGTSASDRILVASFLYYVAETDNFGLDINSGYTKGGVYTPFNIAFVQAANPVENTGYVCVVTVPVNAGEDVSTFTLQCRGAIGVTPAWLTFLRKNADTKLSRLATPLTRQRTRTQTITASANFVFTEKYPYLGAYSLRATLLLNNGQNGKITWNMYGAAENGKKYRDTISGASKDAGIVVAAADGAHQDMYNITVTNNTTGPITATLIIDYLQ